MPAGCKMRLSLIIPTRNAGAQMERLLSAVLCQSLVPDEIIIVDSQSTDGTPETAARFERVRVLSIPQSSFDHGGTRNLALREASGDIVLFMTQDALPVSQDSFSSLLSAFENEHVAAASGRQIAYPDARPAEKLVRAHNYPEQSRVWSVEAIARMGIRAFMISNVFCAYRRDALLAAGGFEQPLLTNEDMLMASALLEQGYALAYCADACVYHSHSFTLREQYRRNYNIGRVLRRYRARFACAGETGEGTKLAASVFSRLIGDRQFTECLRFAADCAARLAGNRMGRLAQRLEEARHD